MKKVAQIILLTLVVFLIGCKADKLEKKAEAYLTEARVLYRVGDLDRAKSMLDTMPTMFPLAYDAKLQGEYLLDSIRRDESRMEVDFLIDSINLLKVELIYLGRENSNEELIEIIEERIDSLEGMKMPYRNLILSIDNAEVKRAACAQCRTAMINSRR